jgi:aminoglycoside phosphotransferase family enzyme
MVDLCEKVTFLSEPASYAGSTAHVRAEETHMSWVFLTDRYVYKLKKPVRYPFLDFSTLSKRSFYCEEELRLNRRLAPDTYLAVVPLYRDRAGRLGWSGPGRVVEWLVQMRRLPRSRMLDAMIVHGRVDEEDVGRIGRLLAGFYGSRQTEVADGRHYVAHFLNEQAVNHAVLASGELNVASLAVPLLDVLDRALASLRSEVDDRILSGRIVEGHGDLRPEHICLVEPLRIIDCLEFDRTMRLIDPYDEVNYLGMECEVQGAPWIRPILLAELHRQLADRPGPRLMALYGLFRALLRARLCLVHLLEPPVRHPDRWRPLAIRYLEMAQAEASILEAEKV